jgi:pentatricopeptide repeat protein
MRARGLAPSAYTYNALVKAECHAGGLEAGMGLVDAMVSDGVRPDRATWLTLLSGARYLGRPDVADLVPRLLVLLHCTAQECINGIPLMHWTHPHSCTAHQDQSHRALMHSASTALHCRTLHGSHFSDADCIPRMQG